MREKLQKLFDLRLTKQSQMMLSKQLALDKIIHVMKSMSGMSYFSPIFIEGNRHISGGLFSYISKGGSISIKRSILCAPNPVWYRQWNSKNGRYSWHTYDPIWKFDLSYIADKRYFREPSDSYTTLDSLSDDPEHLKIDAQTPLDAWYQDSEMTVHASSCEDRHQFEKDIEAMLHQFDVMRREIRTLDCWNVKGLEVVIKCQCGHSLKRGVADFISQQEKYSDIFEVGTLLRCSVCNEKGRATLIPTYRFRDGFFSPGQIGYYSRKQEKSDSFD